MSFDLRNENGDTLSIRPAPWSLYLNLGEAYGWKPQGTTLARPNWDGRYDSNDGQRVSREDARALGAALRAALEDPRLAGKERDVVDAMVRPLIEAFRAETAEELPPEEARAGLETNRPEVAKLIAFVEAGGFTIS